MRRSAIALLVLALLAVTALWWFLFISPRNSKIDTAERELEAAQAQDATLRTQIASLEAILENEVSYIFAIGDMETSIPVSPEADVFIEDVTFLAEQTGVTLKSLSMSPPIEATATDALLGFEIAVLISVEGEYFELLGFLYGLEAMERLVRVDTLNLTPVQDTAADEADESVEGELEEDTNVEIVEPRQRPATTSLQAEIAGKLFTRSGVSVSLDALPPADTGGEPDSGPEPGEGGEGE